MQHMFDPAVGVARRDDRTLDVNDITGKSRGSIATNTSSQRVQAIRPKAMEYDIINPHADKLRMSAYGKNVIASRSGARRSIDVQGSPAGKKLMPKQGEANLREIWPEDERLRQQIDQKARNFDTHDINVNTRGNARAQKLFIEDQERIHSFMAKKERERERSTRAVKTYKNASNVFNHLVDDPALRQKVSRNSQHLTSAHSGSRGGDALDRIMPNGNGPPSRPSYGGFDGEAAQDIAYRADFQPIDLSANPRDPSMGAPSQLSQHKGKRAFAKDHMNVATGQARLFGAESANAAKEVKAKRQGKRIIQLPHLQNKLM